MFKRNSYLWYAINNGIFWFSWSMFACVLTLYLSDSGLNVTEISLVNSAVALCSLASQPILGYLSDKYHSPKKVAIFSLFFTMMTGILFSYTHSFLLLFILNGLTQGVLNGVIPLTDRLMTSSPYAYGTIRLWGSLMYAFGAQVSGYIYENLSPQANFYIFGISTLFVIFSFIKMDESYTKKEKEKITTKDMLKTLLSNKQFMYFILIFFLFQGFTNMLGCCFPLFMSELGMKSTMYGTVILFFTLSEIPTIYLSDRIFKRFKFKTLLLFACVVSLIRFIWYSTCPSPIMIGIFFFFQGISSLLFTLIVVRIMIPMVEEKYLTSAYGISNMIGKGASGLLFSLFTGRILDTVPGLLGFKIVFWICSVGMCICILLCFFMKEPKKGA